VTSSSTAVASLEAARDAKAPIILQISQGGAAYFAGIYIRKNPRYSLKSGKGVSNGEQQASIAGAIAGAHYIRSIAPIYGVPVVLHTDHCAKKLLPWLDGMLDEDEKHFKKHGEPLFRYCPRLQISVAILIAVLTWLIFLRNQRMKISN